MLITSPTISAACAVPHESAKAMTDPIIHVVVFFVVFIAVFSLWVVFSGRLAGVFRISLADRGFRAKTPFIYRGVGETRIYSEKHLFYEIFFQEIFIRLFPILRSWQSLAEGVTDFGALNPSAPSIHPSGKKNDLSHLENEARLSNSLSTTRTNHIQPTYQRHMKSMTGFGSAEGSAGNLRFNVEVSSVNRKQLDLNTILPREWQQWEPLLRQCASQRANRGRITLKVNLDTGNSQATANQLEINQQLFEKYQNAVTQLLGEKASLTPADLIRIPGILERREESPPEEEIEQALEQTANKALDAWDAMRTTEGSHLANDIRQRLATLESEIEQIGKRAGGVKDHYRKQLLTRLEEAGIPADLSDERIVREIGLFAERSDISEETTRLKSHLDQFRKLMDLATPAGRPLDFLIQEINRECNTIGAKANDAQLAQRVVNCKTELEKIREQIQNVE